MLKADAPQCAVAAIRPWPALSPSLSIFHKTSWGFLLHWCCKCCTYLVSPLLIHHVSTFMHPTGMQTVRERAFLTEPIVFEQWTRASPPAGWLGMNAPGTGVPSQITPTSCPGYHRIPVSCPDPTTKTVTITRCPGAGHNWEGLCFPADTSMSPASIRSHLTGASTCSFCSKIYSEDMPMKQTIWWC